MSEFNWELLPIGKDRVADPSILIDKIATYEGNNLLLITVSFLDPSGDPCWERCTVQITTASAVSEKHKPKQTTRVKIEVEIFEVGVEHAVVA